MDPRQPVPKVKPTRRLEITEDDLTPRVAPPPAVRPPTPMQVHAKPVGAALSHTTSHDLANQSALLLAAQMNSKSPGTAIILSLLLTGAGQWYCGHVGRGLAFLGAQILAFLSLFFLIGIVLLPVVWIWAAVDANNLAKQHNARILTQATGVAAGL